MSACSNGHLKLAQIMVAVGPDLNTQTKVAEAVCIQYVEYYLQRGEGGGGRGMGDRVHNTALRPWHV